ncbi:very-long-chain 3-oxoacyl-CoA reductase-B-like isoform X2 [Babylonia areolata]
MDIVLISNDPQKLSEVAEQIVQQFQVSVKVITADFKKTDIYDSIKQQLTGLDIGVLVNNVGINNRRYPCYFLEAEDFEQYNTDIIQVNVLSCVKMTALVLPDMLKRRRGTIINVASIAALRPLAFGSVYCATKAFVRFFSEALNMEYSPQGVTVQAVCPGLVRTSLSREYVKCSALSNTLVLASPDQFARAALRTMGRESTTSAFWPHELQAFFLPMMSDSSLTAKFVRERERMIEHLKKQ